MTVEQIAEALGLYEKQDGFLAFWFSPEGWKITLPGGRFVVGKDLEVWLESPAGQQAVRDKVRELAAPRGVIYQSTPSIDGDPEAHRVIICNYSFREIPEANSESSAWLAALEFLVERKGK